MLRCPERRTCIVRAGAAQPKAHLRVLLPFRSAPDLGAHCLREGGWRVVKQLLLMSHGPRHMPADATGTAAFLPSADGHFPARGEHESFVGYSDGSLTNLRTN